MFNIFNSISTIQNALKKKQQDIYNGPISSIYKAPQSQGAPRSYMGVSTAGSPSAPQSYQMPVQAQKKVDKRVIPTPQVETSVPNASVEYQKRYQDYLNRSQANKSALAEQQRQEDIRVAQENYDTTNRSLQASRSNLDNLMSGIRSRSAASSARLNTQAEANKENARVESGQSQRQLMEDRRQLQAQKEKQYAALGTIDSYGTGSFQSANENINNDFLRMTNENKRLLEKNLFDIDQKLFDAKAGIEEQLATEESKYNDAIIQIENSNMLNEAQKAQLIRSAQIKFETEKTNIYDKYDTLRLTAEKEKVDAQAKLDEAKVADQKLQVLLGSASDTFIKTGIPSTAEDQFLIMKYPKEVEAYANLIKNGQSAGSKNKDTALSMVNRLLSQDTRPITGAMRTGGIPVISSFTGSAIPQADYNGLKSLLALAERGQLKGSGAVSDFEAKMLEKAAMAGLTQDLPDEEFRRRLEILRNDLMSGGATSSEVVNQRGQVITAPDGQQILIVD